MRNLKRVLSLTLASVMLLGMMVIGSSAVEAKKINFTDADEIEYTEAVDVMVALGVLEGNPDGGFNPKGTLTREQAAKIICYMLLGAENAEKLTANKDVFTDVAANRWSAGYISYCVERSILAGTGNGAFNPTGELTGVAFGKMLLVALGYDPAIQGYTGSNWALSVAADMVDAGIAPAGVLLNGTMSREQAAQTAFQTLTADLVRYTQKPVVVETADGGTVTVGAGEVVPNITYNGESGNYAGDAIGKDGYNTQQFCEKYFPKLVKASDTDDFGRPGGVWKLNGADICFAVDEASYTYTAKVTGKSLYNTLGKTTVETYGWTVKTDGGADSADAYAAGKGYGTLVAAKDSTDAFAGSGKGVLTEVYVDGVDKTVTMIVTNTYVATVTRVKSVDDGYEVTVRYESPTLSTTGFDKTVTVGSNDFATDDIVLVTVADDEIKTITAAESVTGEVTATKGTDYIKLDGTQYDRAVSFANIAENPTDATSPAVGSKNAVIYLDAYGYAIAVDAKGTTVEDYLYITDDTKGLGGLSAEAVFSDGTKKDIKVTKIDKNGDGDYDDANEKGGSLNGGDSKGKVWIYAEDDGEYSLKKVTNVGDATNNSGEIKKGSSKVTLSDGSATTTAGRKTIFVNIDDGVTYTGYADVPSFDAATLVGVVKDGVAEIIFIAAGNNSSESSFWFFVKDNKAEVTKSGSNTFREYTVYTKDGEETLITKNLTLNKNYIYKAASSDSQDRLTNVKTDTKTSTDLSDDLDGTNSANVTTVKDGVLVIANQDHYYADATKTSFTYDKEKTVFLVVDAKDDGTEADKVGIGSDKDIDTTSSIVYILTVDDKSDETPLATLVLVVNPAAPAASTESASPAIGTQPAPAAYAKGATPNALTVVATASDGGTLSYQWKSCATVDGTYTDITGETNSSLAVAKISTSSAGTTYYKCTVTNTKDSLTPKSVDSNAVAVKVVEPANAVVADSTEINATTGTEKLPTLKQSVTVSGTTYTVATGNPASEITDNGAKFLGTAMIEAGAGGGGWWVTHDNYVILRFNAPAGYTVAQSGSTVNAGGTTNGVVLDSAESATPQFFYLVLNYDTGAADKTVTINWKGTDGTTLTTEYAVDLP